MTDQFWQEFPSWVTVILDPIAAIILARMLVRGRCAVSLPPFHRIGITICVMGLIGQSYRSFVTITTHISPRDTEMVFWMGKDIGLTVLAIALAASLRKRRRDQSHQS